MIITHENLTQTSKLYLCADEGECAHVANSIANDNFWSVEMIDVDELIPVIGAYNIRRK